VPDNDVLAKAINKLELIIQNNRLFASFDVSEYQYYSQANCKLNKGLVAQEVEMFHTGRYDSYDADADELLTLKVHHNNLNLVENRQNYAEQVWRASEEPIEVNVKGDENTKTIKYKKLFHQYEVRAPLMHGLANQPRLIPPGVKVNLELIMNKQAYCLMQHSAYQTCRTTSDFMKKLAFPYPEDMHQMEVSGLHEKESECDCKAKLQTAEYHAIVQEPKTGPKLENVEDCLKTGSDWKAHTYYKYVPKIQKFNLPNEGTVYIFGVKAQLDKNELFKPDEFLFESVFKQPESKEEYPISTGVKNESAIPFYYPKFTRWTLPIGKDAYDKELNSGPLPKMIVFSGMPYNQTRDYSFAKCMSKTGLYRPGYRIKEFTIFINDEPAYRSPYTHGFQHYINFVKQKNGRWEGKRSSEGGLDYFTYRDQSWLVPITFDDAVGKSAVVKVLVRFDNILDQQYDFLVMKLPYHELHLNSETKGNLFSHMFSHPIFRGSNIE
jgi:hypothetical protein